MAMMDHRMSVVAGDPKQVASINDFTDSLVAELAKAGRNPSKALMRELLAGGLQRALDMGGSAPKQRFMDALWEHVHQFPMQEQQSISRVYPVEISSEYRNLQSLIDGAAPQEAGGPGGREAPPAPGDAPEDASASSAAPVPPALSEVRQLLVSLPQKPEPATLDDALARLKADEVSKALQECDAGAEATFLKDVQLSLHKFSEAAQKELVERFSGLRKEAAKLVDSMTQEVSRWLDEETVMSQRGGSAAGLLAKLRSLFQAILSAPFLTSFRHLGTAEKRGKEGFLLKTALCLRRCAEKRLVDANPEVGSQCAQLRRQFFYVDGYGELMEDWLQSRIKQFNDDFVQRAATVIGNRPKVVQARFRRTFRPGHWLRMSDAHLVEDIYALFLDEAFPRHVLTNASVASVLRKAAAAGEGDLHVYADIARLPPPHNSYPGPPPQDQLERALVTQLLRLPPFQALKRVRPGVYQFGRVEAALSLRGGRLMANARGSSGPTQDMSAEEFFDRYGPEEFPTASNGAVQGAGPSGPGCTVIEALGAFAAAPAAAGFAAPLGAPALVPGYTMPSSTFGGGLTMPPPPLLNPTSMVAPSPVLPVPGLPALGGAAAGFGALAAAPGAARYEPYPTGLAATAPPGAKFGMDDDEI